MEKEKMRILELMQMQMMRSLIDKVPDNPQQKVCKEMAKYIDPWCAPTHLEKTDFLRITSNTGWIKSEMNKYCRNFKTKKERSAKANLDDQVEFFCSFDKDQSNKMDRKKVKKWVNKLIKLITEDEKTADE